MMKWIPVLWTIAWLSLTSCNTQKAVTVTPTAPVSYDALEERQLDTLFVTASPLDKDQEATSDIDQTYELPLYNPSYTRTNDLLHTRLDLRFDWNNEKVLGKASLTFKPLFYPTSTLTLDAKDFEIRRITLAPADAPLKYSYDGLHIAIELGQSYTRTQEFTVNIEYTASPSETGGSAAITSDKGLFFINPRGEEGDKPRQIWTQGETENNSRWFPTIDKPNERCTQEMFLTVEDRFTTLSNGLLISSTKNPDGTRTDYWKMDQPHAPYLFMLAIGEYAVVREQWEGIPVDYYVEPAFEKDARAIYTDTPEMLSFFSEKLGMKYPWPKFAQVVVRDYVSGAMENTTAVIFGEYIQRHSRDLIDDHTNEKVVAHEMFHHWFGDLVTCESWANLTMNEGFANYSEYLWMEHKYGRDAADYHLLEEWSGYFGSAQGEVHPLIHYGYPDKENMFDAHSYNKGGSVLHMLRHYVGDEAFFASLNKYLTDHAFGPVEVHDLRLAFEAVTGQDLNWFFNQWYLQQGHPVLQIDYGYDETAGTASVTIRQTQDPEKMPPVFELRTAVDIYTGEDGPAQRYPITVTRREQTFTFPVSQKPRLLNFDPEHVLLAISQDNKPDEELAYQFFHAPRLLDRFEAIQKLGDQDTEDAKMILKTGLKDPFWVIRAIALEYVPLDEESTQAMIRKMAIEDPRSEVRASALARLAQENDGQAVPLAKQAIEKDQAYPVISTALSVLTEMDKETALAYAAQLENETNDEIIDAIGQIYIESGDPRYMSFFEKHFEQIDGFNAISFLGSYQSLAIKAEPAVAMQGAAKLKMIATNMGQSPWRRFGAMRALSDWKKAYQEQLAEARDEAAKVNLQQRIDTLTEMMEEIKEKETDPQLAMLYQQF